MKKIIISTALILSSTAFFAQQVFELLISPKVENSALVLNENYTSANSNEVKIDHFDYYVSDIVLVHDGGTETAVNQRVFLVEPNNFLLNLGTLNIQNLEQIKFGIGVPQDLNHLDISTYPETSPLSFQTPSMHWGWAAGYMHMIVGGYADGNNDGTPEAYFELHNLGDQNYYEVVLDVNAFDVDGKKRIQINCNLDTWLGTTALSQIGIKHGENNENFTVMKNIQLRPVFTIDETAKLNENEITNIKVAYLSSDKVELFWDNNKDLNFIKVVDASGKLINQYNVLNTSKIVLTKEQNKISIVSFFDGKGNLISTQKF